MRRKMKHPYLRSLVWFATAALSLVSLVGAPAIHSFLPLDSGYRVKLKATKAHLSRLGLENKIDQDALADLIEYQHTTGKTFSQVLREPAWASKFGYTTEQFKATWYISNPFELLPVDLQEAIRVKKTPFRTRAQVWDWCKSRRAPVTWKKALKAALIETTPLNLWRTAHGAKPYAKNGEFLKPIVVERAGGIYEVKDGHIATDPRIIPTNSEVLLLIKVNGQERILKVKATDIGGGIKGKHVDLPIYLNANGRNSLPNVLLPKKQISNPVVQILIPQRVKPNPNQKA
jgi:3D (Asp-Asp-Asp) domain-containing protein